MVGPTKRASEQGPPIDLLDSLEREREASKRAGAGEAEGGSRPLFSLQFKEY